MLKTLTSFVLTIFICVGSFNKAVSQASPGNRNRTTANTDSKSIDNSKSYQSFVTRTQHQFTLNNQPYYYIGTNYWYGSFLGLQKDNTRGVERLRKELDFLKSQGVTNLRLLAGVEGSGQINGVKRVEPPLQPKQGVFDLAKLKGLDIILDEMGKRNMKAVIFLSNNWEWSGGFLQYLNWNGQIPDSILRRKLNWDEQRDYTSKFYGCENCIKSYDKQVRLIVNRKNTVNNKLYKNDPAIMSWELVNEPRPMRTSMNEAYARWISSTASLIKSLDKNHLVTLGHEGYQATDGNMKLFESVHADKNVDYLTIHIWPKNWGWFRESSMKEDFNDVVAKTQEYINIHIASAQRLNKPLVIEEFGLPRDGHSFDINATTSLRDEYYQSVFNKWRDAKAGSGVVAGVNFWAFSGTSRPIPGQVFWKKGDDYMGDPPMEEQGLNGVFDRDKTTWSLIRSYTSGNGMSSYSPVDTSATKETVNLYNNLRRLMAKGVMFGHQDDLAYGVNWKYQTGRSDVKDVTGDYPAVYGFELGRLETDQPVNIDSVPFDKMKGYIEEIYGRGGVVTLSWHLNNPLTGKSAWDPAPGTVASILPGGEKNELYKSWLDKIAVFITSLRGKNNEPIPVIFRPFHELNGNWFWWGKDHCTPEEYKKMFQFTVSYLRDTKKLHNLLIAFNTDRFGSNEEYLEKYPGDEWTDIVGFDVYQRQSGAEANQQFITAVDRMLTQLEAIATTHHKLPALTEFGYPGLEDSLWWTSTLLKTLANHKISYALGWRNAGPKEFYLPYRGQSSASDFKKFYDDPKTLFQGEVTNEHLYLGKGK